MHRLRFIVFFCKNSPCMCVILLILSSLVCMHVGKGKQSEQSTVTGLKSRSNRKCSLGKCRSNRKCSLGRRIDLTCFRWWLALTPEATPNRAPGRLLCRRVRGESVSTVPLAGLSRGQRWRGGAVLGSARTIFSIFFSRKGAIFFLEEKETGPLQLEVVGVN